MHDLWFLSNWQDSDHSCEKQPHNIIPKIVLIHANTDQLLHGGEIEVQDDPNATQCIEARVYRCSNTHMHTLH